MSDDRHGPVAPGWQPEARRRMLRRRVRGSLLVVGLLLFVLSNLGARLGFVLLPFDPHHVLGQYVLGPAFALLGATLLGRDS